MSVPSDDDQIQTTAIHIRPQHVKPGLEPDALLHLARSSKDVFHDCVALALSTTCATTALILLYRPAQDVLEVVAAAGHLADEALGHRLQRGQALGWQVFEAAEELLIREAATQPEQYFVSGQSQPGMYLGVPLVDPDSRVFGVLSVDTTHSAETLTNDDALRMSLLGQAAGVAYARLLALEQAQATARRFEYLARLSADLELLQDPDEIARQALLTLLDISGFAIGGVFELFDDGQVALRQLAGTPPAGTLNTEGLRRPHAPVGIVQQVIAAGHSLLLADYQRSGSTYFDERAALSTALAAPLRSQGRVVGVIGLGQFGVPQEVSPELITLLDMVAARIDQAVERAAGMERLRQLREAALHSVGRVLEYRDDETSGHTDRVTALALRLGEALGLPQTELVHLRWGAYLHDIGKVAVSDAILRKPGPLTPEERLIMQRHVVTGDDVLLDEMFAPGEVREVVRHHHERWDGTGYPDGLAGAAIPLLARIFSVVDVYDALTSRRPYKEAWPHEAALAELLRCAGTQFDARIVQAFLKVMADDAP